MTVQIDWNTADDADLVGAAAAGDRAAFARIYDRYADRLYDFCLGMVGASDAADCVQEAFCSAAVDLPKLRDPGKLLPWLYSIARHQALRALRARRREMTSDDLPEEPSTEAGPDVLASRNELAGLVAQAEGGLSDRDREVLDLTYRHGLTVQELAQALDVSNESAKKMVQRLRDTVEKSLGALLVVRQVSSGRNDCQEMAAVLAGWDGEFTILMRKRVSRHIESCPNCDYERSRLVNPRALLGAAPVLVPAPAWLRHQTLSQVRLGSASSGGTVAAAHSAGHVAGGLSVTTGRLVALAATIVAVPAVAWAVMVGGGASSDAPTSPAHVVTSVSMTVSAQQPTLSAVPTTSPVQPTVATPQPDSSPPPSVPQTITSAPSSGDQGAQSAPSPAAGRSEAPEAPTQASTTQAAPPSHPAIAPPSHPSASANSPRPQRPSQPTVTHCPDGSTVSGNKSCPTPEPPAQPNCPHVAVEGPVCGRTSSSGN